MTNSSAYIYAIITNVNDFVKSGKNVKILDVNITKMICRFKKAKPYFIKICKKIYNDIENSYYTHWELALYLLYQRVFEAKLKVQNINKDSVKHVRKLFTKEQLLKDKEIVQHAMKKRGINEIDELFKILEDGESIVYKLIRQKIITPIYFLRYQGLTNDQKNSILVNEEYKRFVRIVDKIYNIAKGGS